MDTTGPGLFWTTGRLHTFYAGILGDNAQVLWERMEMREKKKVPPGGYIGTGGTLDGCRTYRRVRMRRLYGCQIKT